MVVWTLPKQVNGHMNGVYPVAGDMSYIKLYNPVHGLYNLCRDRGLPYLYKNTLEISQNP